jgi:heterodisulfide reductase subunit A-like polyferredoxin
MKRVKVTIDGITTEADDRAPLISVAEKIGVKIPTLCHHPLIEPYGACRVCMVEVHMRNRVRMVTACNYPVTDGIEVFTKTDRVRRNRTMILEWLLARCGHVPVLNALAEEYGITEPRFGRGDDDCILCGLCVRVCSDVVGANVLGFFNRGTTREVSTAYGETSEKCIACGACAYVCPTGSISIEDDAAQIRHELPLGPMTPIYIPTMQAVPHKPVIDASSCIHFKTDGCRVCATVCEAKAIDHGQQDTVEEFQVGSIIVATGFQTVDAKRVPHYGYGVYPNVFTAMQVEHMVNASGPTNGTVQLHDGSQPESVGIIHCVGSRDKRTHEYCSRVCCMYSLKLAHLVHERSGARVYNFYIDMRAFGKGYEEFYNRLLAEGVEFIRGRVAEVSDWAITPMEQGKLVIRVEDTLAGVVRRIPVDMVVLSTGLEARSDADAVRRMFNMSCSSEGFFLERHPKLAPVSTFTDGVFLAGCAQGPKDIPDTVAQAGAAAAEAMALIDKGQVELEAYTAHIDEERCSGCQVCVPLCPFSAIEFNREAKVSRLNQALCKGCGTCVAACPSQAAQQHHFTDTQIMAEIEGVLAL